MRIDAACINQWACTQFQAVQSTLSALCRKVADYFACFLGMLKNLFCWRSPETTPIFPPNPTPSPPIPSSGSAHPTAPSPAPTNPAPVSPAVPLTPGQIELRRAAQQRELAAWQARMGVNMKQHGPCYVDLSGRLSQPNMCSVLGMHAVPQIGHYGHNYPMLERLVTVKMPARQIAHFPEAVKRELSSCNSNQLDVYFIVWKDILPAESAGSEKRNMVYHPLAYPWAGIGENHNEAVNMGMFNVQGIESRNDHGAIPINTFGQQNVHLHPSVPPGAMCISPDNARFYLPQTRQWSSFYNASHFADGRGIAVFGVILNANCHGLESNVFERPVEQTNITLQQYKEGIERSGLDRTLVQPILDILNFHHDPAIN